MLAQNILRTRQGAIYTAGRPPWYDAQGQSLEPFTIGWFLVIVFLLMDKKINYY